MKEVDISIYKKITKFILLITFFYMVIIFTLRLYFYRLDINFLLFIQYIFMFFYPLIVFRYIKKLDKYYIFNEKIIKYSLNFSFYFFLFSYLYAYIEIYFITFKIDINVIPHMTVLMSYICLTSIKRDLQDSKINTKT